MIQEREGKPFLKGVIGMIHYKKKKNLADVAPSDYQEGVWDLLGLEASQAQCLLPAHMKAKPVKVGVLS